MNCSKCGVDGQGGFCSACGAQLAPPSQPVPVADPPTVVTKAPLQGSANAQTSKRPRSNERPGSMFNPFARHSWDSPPKRGQPRETPTSAGAVTAILDYNRPAPDEGVIDPPKTGNKIFVFILLAMAALVVVAILITRSIEPYVSPQERASISAEKVCHFPEEAIEGGTLSTRPVPTLIYFVDVHQTLQDDAGFYIPYVSASGHHVAKVLLDTSTVDSARDAIPEVSDCG